MRPRVELRDRGQTLGKAIREIALRVVEEAAGQAWPKPEYQQEPERFLRDHGVAVIMAHQVEIMLAVLQHNKVAVSAGQKIGKTFLLAWLIIWYWCSFPEANVTIMMTTKSQMTGVLWKEIRNQILRCKAVTGIDLLANAKMFADPQGGIIAADGRTIIAKNVQKLEALGGISGENQLWVVDEASFLDLPLFDAIMGNTSGDTGGNTRILFTGNPTRSEGPFFDIFHRWTLSQDPLYGWWAKIYSARAIAEDNKKRGLNVPGVATLEKCDEFLALYGAEHPFYVVRVLGRFLTHESGKICPLHVIKAAQASWVSASDWEGPLSIGVDPAGKSEGSDAWGFAVVRGKKCLHTGDRNGLSIEAGLAEACRLLEAHRQGDEIPRLLSDVDGVKGIEFQIAARNLSEKLLSEDRRRSFTYHGVKPSDYAKRRKQSYDRVRDELWGLLGEWLRDGAIPADFGLEAELYAPSWQEVLISRGGHPVSVLKATPKDILRAPEVLGRSPNKADALALAIWTPAQFLEEAPDTTYQPPPQAPEPRQELSALGAMATGMSPYDLLSQAMGRR